jgi:hypothetical protein
MNESFKRDYVDSWGSQKGPLIEMTKKKNLKCDYLGSSSGLKAFSFRIFVLYIGYCITPRSSHFVKSLLVITSPFKSPCNHLGVLGQTLFASCPLQPPWIYLGYFSRAHVTCLKLIFGILSYRHLRSSFLLRGYLIHLRLTSDPLDVPHVSQLYVGHISGILTF